jgi:hypothetical protein
MPKLTTTIREFAKARKIDCTRWGIADTATVLVVRDIDSRQHADALAAFLAEQNMGVEVVMGDRRSGTWVVMARAHKTAPAEDEPAPAASHARRHRRPLARRRHPQ